MLTPVTKRKGGTAGGSFAIVASRYNARYVDAMLRAAQSQLKRAKARKIRIVRVPGAYEIPIVAASLARSDVERPDAILCLGVVLRGETVHAAHIGDAVSRALMDIQLEYGVPVIHEVLLLENQQQAEVRCLSKEHNRGAEAAQTAVEMVAVMRQVPFRRP
jgi:6,7-dimethyl-8-ribityllumazine synthase